MLSGFILQVVHPAVLIVLELIALHKLLLEGDDQVTKAAGLLVVVSGCFLIDSFIVRGRRRAD